MAVYRARESERPDAVFHDPFARALAGERGEQIARAVPFGDENSWAFVARTYAFDRLIDQALAEGVDLVVNLAAGLDARPYRMALPPALRWVEVDLPEILDYKSEILASAIPRCALERVTLDLSNADARRGLFDRLGRASRRARSVAAKPVAIGGVRIGEGPLGILAGPCAIESADLVLRTVGVSARHFRRCATRMLSMISSDTWSAPV